MKNAVIVAVALIFSLLAGGASCSDQLERDSRQLDKASKDLERITDNNPEINKAVAQIELGSTVKEVEAQLGKPDDRQIFQSSYGEDVTYYYGQWQLSFSGDSLESKNKY